MFKILYGNTCLWTVKMETILLKKKLWQGRAE